MKITREWLHANSSGLKGHGWTAEQVGLLGLRWATVMNHRGWISKLEGKEIPDKDARRFEFVGARERAKKMAKAGGQPTQEYGDPAENYESS